MSRPFVNAFVALLFPVLGLLAGVFGTAAWAADPAEETIFQSSELRIYRTVNRDGMRVVVLTNVDAAGEYFPGRPADAPVQGERPAPPISSIPAAPLQAPEPPASPAVRVVVNGAEGDAGAPSHEVEVSSGSAGGTTVIVNIHPPQPSPRETVVVPEIYPPITGGVLVGPYRYPDHLYFLGYAPGTSSPSYFGGLGLNAGNRFGLKTSQACDRGYDCMFGPTGDRP